MKKYIAPITEVDTSQVYEYEILAATGASSTSMTEFEGLPITGRNQVNPTFNANKFDGSNMWQD